MKYIQGHNPIPQTKPQVDWRTIIENTISDLTRVAINPEVDASDVIYLLRKAADLIDGKRDGGN